MKAAIGYIIGGLVACFCVGVMHNSPGEAAAGTVVGGIAMMIYSGGRR